jgi:DNA modification methylase
MTPYYQDEQVTLWHGDSRDILPRLTGIDAVIADPPYDVGRTDYQDQSCQDVVGLALAATAGPIVWFGAAPRLRDDLLAFPVPPQRVLIWHALSTRAQTRSYGMFYHYHPLYCWQLSGRHEGPQIDVLRYCTDVRQWFAHSSTKPLPLMRALVGFAPAGGLLCDPFAGSGTTLCAAVLEGRRAIGIEQEERYCAIAVQRLQEAYGRKRRYADGTEQPAPVELTS